MTPDQCMAIIDLYPDAVLLVAEDGEVKGASKAMGQLLGYTWNELNKKRIDRLFHSPVEMWQPYLKECFRSQKKWPGTISLRKKNDEEIACHCEGVAFKLGDALGTPLVFLRIVDGAERERQELERQRDQFLALLAHGLRSPLTPVMNGLQVLRMTEADPIVQEQARLLIERQIRQLTRMINDLLEVSRLSRGKIRLKKEPIDLPPLIRNLVEERRLPFESAGLALIGNVQELPGLVMGEAVRLTQILNQLLDNAAQFTPKGGRVFVSLTHDAENQQAVLTVRDTGIGIEAELLPNLFDMFSETNVQRHRGKAGLGVGLTLVKELVEMHDGRIEVSSEGIDRGSEFTVWLPVVDEVPLPVEEPVAPASEGQHRRIVIIEDNKDAADSLCMLLEFLGYDVRVAYTGPAGVKLAEEWEPAVVLSDIGLPGLDGWGVARELRQHPSTTRTRLIAITAYGMDSDRNLSREAGFEAHLIKPVDIDVLRRLLTKKSELADAVSP